MLHNLLLSPCGTNTLLYSIFTLGIEENVDQTLINSVIMVKSNSQDESELIVGPVNKHAISCSYPKWELQSDLLCVGVKEMTCRGATVRHVLLHFCAFSSVYYTGPPSLRTHSQWEAGKCLDGPGGPLCLAISCFELFSRSDCALKCK